jgi:hypothetical protein
MGNVGWCGNVTVTGMYLQAVAQQASLQSGILRTHIATTRFEYLQALSFVDFEYQVLNEACGYAHGELTGR